jgi:uncharacterized protein YndB with AHSA1/START domain
MTPDTLLGTLTRTGDDAEVVFERVYDTDPADLWAALTEPERLARWFAPVHGDLREGGHFTIHFDDNDVPDCRLASCDRPRRYSWEWSHSSHTSLVTVAVAPAGTGARLHLTHTRLAVSQAPDYAAGWEVYVRRLAEFLSGGEVCDTWAQDWGNAREGYATQLG